MQSAHGGAARWHPRSCGQSDLRRGSVRATGYAKDPASGRRRAATVADNREGVQKMRRTNLLITAVLVAGMLCGRAVAADHADGPRASADPSADITDVFAWMSPDAGRLNLVMDLVR